MFWPCLAACMVLAAAPSVSCNTMEKASIAHTKAKLASRIIFLIVMSLSLRQDKAKSKPPRAVFLLLCSEDEIHE